MTTDPRTYWSSGDFWERHPDYTVAHRRQKDAIDTALAIAVEEPPGTILEVGPGRGRIRHLLRSTFPLAQYTGIDVNPALAVEEFIHGAIQDLKTDRQWDLVVASEVLMHIPPEEVELAAEAMMRAANDYILIAEWSPEVMKVPDVIGPLNWPHDYLSLFGTACYAARTDSQVVMVFER